MIMVTYKSVAHPPRIKHDASVGGPGYSCGWLVNRDTTGRTRMPKDFRGREVITAADLEQMRPGERQATFEESVVTDLESVPADFLTRVRSRLAPRVAQRDREQAAARGPRHEP